MKTLITLLFLSFFVYTFSQEEGEEKYILCSYVEENNIKEVKDLLKSDKINKNDLFKIECLDRVWSRRVNILQLAYRLESMDIAKYLISYMPDINQQDSKGYNPLFYAIVEKNEDMVDYLISKGADLEVRLSEIQFNYMTPLIFSLSEGLPEMAKKLIETGANVDAQNSEGESALFYAKEYPDIFHLLLDKGANVNVHEYVSGSTLLHSLVGYPDLFLLLIDKGADVTRTAFDGTTVLHDLVNEYKSSLSSHDKLILAKRLVEAGADVNAVTKNSYSLSMECNSILRKCDDEEVKEYLVKQGAEECPKTQYQAMEISLAISDGNMEEIDRLLESGYDINARDNDGQNALINAVLADNTELVKYLVGKGADVNVKSYYGMSSIFICRNKDIYDILLQHGADLHIISPTLENPLHRAAFAHNPQEIEVLKALIEAGVNVNQQNMHGQTPLMIAAQSGSFEGVKLLVAGGADIHIRDFFNNTTLIFAVSSLDVERVKYMIEKGANVNALNRTNQDALSILMRGTAYFETWFSCSEDYLDIADILISKGANIYEDKNGQLRENIRTHYESCTELKEIIDRAMSEKREE